MAKEKTRKVLGAVAGAVAAVGIIGAPVVLVVIDPEPPSAPETTTTTTPPPSFPTKAL